MSNDLLSKTLGLFEPTTRSQETEGPETAGEPARAEEPKETEAKPKKPRRYEKEHPAFPLRIRPEDKARIQQQAREIGVSMDTIAAALVHASLDALEEGHLILAVAKDIVPQQDALGRSRQRIVTTCTWQWSCQAQERSD